MRCQPCSSSQYTKSPCTETANTECAGCSKCAANQFEYHKCSQFADTVCDENVPAYIVFISHINLNSVQFFAKPRTYLVNVGNAILGPPPIDNDGNNLTSDDWLALSIPERLACYDNRLGIGDTNESGVGIEKTIFVQTTVKVTGPQTAADIIANTIACEGCFETIAAAFVSGGYTTAEGEELLLNISDPYFTFNLSFPISNAAARAQIPAAAAILVCNVLALGLLWLGIEDYLAA